MKTSVVVTVLNEQKSISALVEALTSQTKRADEIIFVDGGSKDQTTSIIKHFQRRYGNIKLFIKKSTRAQGRNYAIEIATSELIAVTDAGCLPEKKWLENITKPFENTDVGMVAGFYKMIANTDFQKAASVFLGTLPSKFNLSFLPSSRSVAFKKVVWEELGGYPENIKGAAEDTVFNYKALKAGVKIARAKNAIVLWEIPNHVSPFFHKIFEYAKGDIGSGIWLFPSKGFSSHNLKALSIFLRYVLGILVLFLGFTNLGLLIVLFGALFLYCFMAYRKTYIEYNNVKASFWSIILQFVSDFGVMWGFINGLFKRNY